MEKSPLRGLDCENALNVLGLGQIKLEGRTDLSKNETPMTRWYWRQEGGTLIEEFEVVKRTPENSRRVLDGVIIKNGEFRIAKQSEVSVEGKDIIVIQTKASRLGMYLMGQALFSRQLIMDFMPKSIKAVALCARDDAVLRPLLEQYEGMEVVVCPPELLD